MVTLVAGITNSMISDKVTLLAIETDEVNGFRVYR